MGRVDRHFVDISAPAADQHDRQRDHEARELKDGFEGRLHNFSAQRSRRGLDAKGPAAIVVFAGSPFEVLIPTSCRKHHQRATL